MGALAQWAGQLSGFQHLHPCWKRLLGLPELL